MKWEKIGHIFCPLPNQYDWMSSHASYPTPVPIDHQSIAIYFSCRSTTHCSHIAKIILNMENFSTFELSESPIISPGARGMFDDSGTSVACITRLDDGSEYLYYVGWNLCLTVPFRNSIGLAIKSAHSKEFKRHSFAPIMDRNAIDPLSLSYPWVIQDEGKFKMWYGSTLDWGQGKNDMIHVIKYAESHDGIQWIRSGVTTISSKNSSELAFSKPCVIKDPNTQRYRMWYSYRGERYKIGYAESLDGLSWERADHQVGIGLSSSGWDSEEMAYPNVFEFNKQLYMLYNGNQYGKTGFGLARLI